MEVVRHSVEPSLKEIQMIFYASIQTSSLRNQACQDKEVRRNVLLNLDSLTRR